MALIDIYISKSTILNPDLNSISCHVYGGYMKLPKSWGCREKSAHGWPWVLKAMVTTIPKRHQWRFEVTTWIWNTDKTSIKSTSKPWVLWGMIQELSFPFCISFRKKKQSWNWHLFRTYELQPARTTTWSFFGDCICGMIWKWRPGHDHEIGLHIASWSWCI